MLAWQTLQTSVSSLLFTAAPLANLLIKLFDKMLAKKIQNTKY